MKRVLISALLVLGGICSATGCRSCQSCHDYDRPVADCECGSCTACGNGRAGSVLSGGYATGTVDGAAMYEGEAYEMATE